MPSTRARLVVLAFSSAIVAIGSPGLTMARTPTEAAMKKPSPKQQISQLRKRVGKIEAIASDLEALAKEPMPKKLPVEDRESWPKFNEFVARSAGQLRTAAVACTEAIDALEPELAQHEDPSRAIDELSMSFDLRYLELQTQMQSENRAFTMISNIMKTKHDTVKNSISNVR